MSSGLIDAPSKPPGHKPPRPRRKWLWWLVALVTVVVLVAGGTVAGVYVKLAGNVKHDRRHGGDLGAPARPRSRARR